MQALDSGAPLPLLHVLMVEDKPEDFELVVRELDDSGLQINTTRVTTERELVTELGRRKPDLVLSDHACAAFDSFGALAQLRANFFDVPFILVSGVLSEALIIRALERGMDDWVNKNQLSNLLPAVLRALRLADERRQRRLLEVERDHCARNCPPCTTCKAPGPWCKSARSAKKSTTTGTTGCPLKAISTRSTPSGSATACVRSACKAITPRSPHPRRPPDPPQDSGLSLV